MQSGSATDRRVEPSELSEIRDSSIARILLLVEGDQIGLDLGDLLETLGYSVDDILTSASVVFAKDFQFKSDLVVVDLELQPEIDPIEAGRLIEARWLCPIVYLADDVQQANRVAELGGGAPHVMWPFAPGPFDEAIQTALGRCSNETK